MQVSNNYGGVSRRMNFCSKTNIFQKLETGRHQICRLASFQRYYDKLCLKLPRQRLACLLSFTITVNIIRLTKIVFWINIVRLIDQRQFFRKWPKMFLLGENGEICWRVIHEEKFFIEDFLHSMNVVKHSAKNMT